MPADSEAGSNAWNADAAGNRCSPEVLCPEYSTKHGLFTACSAIRVRGDFTIIESDVLVGDGAIILHSIKTPAPYTPLQVHLHPPGKAGTAVVSYLPTRYCGEYAQPRILSQEPDHNWKIAP